MSIRADIRRALRPAEMEPWEDRVLFAAIRQVIRRIPSGDGVQIPAITKAGKAYLLTLQVVGGVIDRFEVEHEPDRGTPAFLAYLAKLAEHEAERGAPYGEIVPSEGTEQ